MPASASGSTRVDVGVVDPQGKQAGALVGEAPVRDRGERRAEMEGPGRAGREAHSDHARNLEHARRCVVGLTLSSPSDDYMVVSWTVDDQRCEPFVYSRPVPPEDVIDRDGETQQLLRSVVGGHYVRLYAPRKYGKTSLLRRALQEGEEREGLIPILVDLYRVVSLADVAVRLERAYARQLKGAVRARIEDFLQKTGIGLSLGAFGISARLQLDPSSLPCRPSTRCSRSRCGWRKAVATGRSSSSTSSRTSTRSPTSTGW